MGDEQEMPERWIGKWSGFWEVTEEDSSKPSQKAKPF